MKELLEAYHGLAGWLSGSKIEEAVRSGKILISPFLPAQINPNSYNYCLSDKLLRIANDVIDLKIEDQFEEIIIDESGYLLKPGECYLGSTRETFGSDYFAALITGRSSIGRKFVTNHVTAGLIDVGFCGEITLEITCTKPTIVYPNIPFGQIFWFSLLGDSVIYDGKYMGQSGPTPSRLEYDKNP